MAASHKNIDIRNLSVDCPRSTHHVVYLPEHQYKGSATTPVHQGGAFVSCIVYLLDCWVKIIYDVTGI